MRFAVYQISRQGGRERNEDRMGYAYTRESGLFVLAEPVVCELVDGVPTMPECGWTPLVLNFAADQPIEMLASDAAFDIAGVGVCLDSDWPSAATPWLAVDLDRNGFIDAGHELFGSGTQLASGGRAAHGFVALAPFDDDHDGRRYSRNDGYRHSRYDDGHPGRALGHKKEHWHKKHR